MQTDKGVKINLGHKLGSGGGGDVYALPNHKAAKILKPGIATAHMENMAMLMVTAYRSGKINNKMTWDGGIVTTVFIWPEALIYDDSNIFCGTIMESFSDAIDSTLVIKNYYYGKEQWKGFSKIKNRFILAYRIAIVFDRFYSQEILQHGDLKSRHILIDKNGFPIIIDADNISIFTTNGWLHPERKMGTDNYKSPEYTFTPTDFYSDYFSIAVLLYELLFLIHPYDGTTIIDGQTRQEAMNKYLYVHGPNSNQYIKIPEQQFAVKTLPEEIQKLFYWAFCETPSKRPTPKEWANVLLDSIQNNKIDYSTVNKMTEG
jgi:DNA-binding helix-hairpin-helix protein with protein kinase domain